MYKPFIPALTLALLSQAAHAADVAVFVRGASSDQGIVRVTLQRGDKALYEPGVDVKATDNFSAGGEIAFLFQNVAPGTYYIAAMHDANSNRDWDKDVDGAGFSISDTAMSVNEALFDVGGESLVLYINLRYGW